MCLNDKILILFGHIFGHERVQDFPGGMNNFFKVVSETDMDVAALRLDSEEHATKVLQKISSYFK